MSLTTDQTSPPNIPHGARVLVRAAKELLIEEGFAALSLDNISRRAEKNKAMVRHYFGGKDGLLAALVNDLFHDAVTGLVTQTESLPDGEERLHVFMERSRQLIYKPEFRAFFDILPHALRDDDLRTRIAELYEQYRALNRRCLTSQCRDEARTATLASLVIALVDGLTIQAALDPERFSPSESFAMLETMARHILEDAETAS